MTKGWDKKDSRGWQKLAGKEPERDVTPHHSTSYFLRVPRYDTTGNLQRENVPRRAFSLLSEKRCPESPGTRRALPTCHAMTIARDKGAESLPVNSLAKVRLTSQTVR